MSLTYEKIAKSFTKTITQCETYITTLATKEIAQDEVIRDAAAKREEFQKEREKTTKLLQNLTKLLG